MDKKMKIIRNNIIPFKGFKAINLCGVLFVRKNAFLSEEVLNHERIHSAQIKEMKYIFFYLWYVVEWVIRLFMSGNAYRNISFEREAYDNQSDMDYLSNRSPFDWADYISNY